MASDSGRSAIYLHAVATIPGSKTSAVWPVFTVSEILHLEKSVCTKMTDQGQPRSSLLLPIERLGVNSYWWWHL